MTPALATMTGHISNLIMKRNYPCPAAVKSFADRDYEIGFFQNFGSGDASETLAKDLVRFAATYDRTQSIYSTYWAIFPDSSTLTEEEFENRLWAELAALVARPEYSKKWDPHFSSNPEDKNFCFSLNERAYFVVGLHQNSSRLARQFPCPVLVFNLYEQFRKLDEKGQFEPMIQTSRKRDIKFQGHANPVVLENGNDWEAIQFSGRRNDQNWKCPFSRFMRLLKS